MAFFSRGKRDRKKSPEPEPADSAPDVAPDAAPESARDSAPESQLESAADGGSSTPETTAQADASAPGASAEGTDAGAEASVGISVSAFRGVGAAPEAPARPPAREVAPAATETVAGLRDNVLLAEALAALPDAPMPKHIADVARQLLQGHLFLRVQGDARTLLSEGKQLPLAIVTAGEENFVVAYSGGAGLAASMRSDGNVDTSAMGQPTLTVLRYVLGGPYAGLVIDPASSPARAILRRDMLQRMLDALDPQLTIKTLLSAQRNAATASAVAEALARVPVWVAVSQVAGSDRFGVAEARTPDGERYLELFSHPLEVVALGRGDQPAPMNAEQLGKALRADAGITGVVIDPAGPWIRLARADLGRLISG